MAPEQSIVFIIDDDQSIREALTSLVRSVGHEVMSFRSTSEFLACERPDLAACLVLDVRLPDQSGLEFQRTMTRSGIDLPIIFITGHGDIPMSVAAMKAGAVEFLAKPFRDQDLLDAVHKAIGIDRDLRADLHALHEIAHRFATLTQRQREIMTLVAAGKLNKQIAADLSLSEVTVKVHRAQVMRKMQAHSLPELVRFADQLAALTPKA